MDGTDASSDESAICHPAAVTVGGSEPEQPAGELSGRGRLVLYRIVPVVAVWLPVVCIEWWNLRNEGIFALLVPPGELAPWLLAVLVTTLVVRRAVGRWRRAAAATVTAATCLCLLAVCTYMTNWSVIHPRSYFALHRQGFEAVAALVAPGPPAVRGEDEYAYRYEGLPHHLADLSTDGRVWIGGGDDMLIAFVPEFLGSPDGGFGYLYLTGTPEHDLTIDVNGDLCTLSRAWNLGGGWWWCPPEGA